MSSSDDNSTKSNGAYWRWQLGGWGVLFVSQFLVAWNRFSIPPLNAAVNYGLLMSLFLASTHLIRALSKKRHWILLTWKALLIRLFVSGMGLAILIAAVHLGVALMLQSFKIDIRQQLNMPANQSLVVVFFNAQAYLWLWIAGYFGVALIRQRQRVGDEESRLRAALRTAELNLLKSQLNPHFLFNALNTVRALINENPQRAELAVTQLARTLRYSLNSSRDELVSLANELDIVKDYLGIEALRLAERLTIVQAIAANTLPAQIPIMLLQTLVENAVKHGISQLPQGGTLHISARMENSMLIIVVTNDRPLIKNAGIPSDRVGLANAIERLRLMIGPTATLALDLSQPLLAKATVRIPQSASKA